MWKLLPLFFWNFWSFFQSYVFMAWVSHNFCQHISFLFYLVVYFPADDIYMLQLVTMMLECLSFFLIGEDQKASNWEAQNMVVIEKVSLQYVLFLESQLVLVLILSYSACLFFKFLGLNILHVVTIFSVWGNPFAHGRQRMVAMQLQDCFLIMVQLNSLCLI